MFSGPPPLPQEECEGQRGHITRPQSHSSLAEESGQASEFSDSRALNTECHVGLEVPSEKETSGCAGGFSAEAEGRQSENSAREDPEGSFWRILGCLEHAKAGEEAAFQTTHFCVLLFF